MKANPRNHTRHVWATLDAIGAIAWEFDHFMPIILKKIRKGQYTYVKNSDGTYTVYFIIWLYWFFPGNRYFLEFNQTRITNGAIGTNCDLLMKGPDHARADAVSKHPVPILTHPFPSNEAIDSYMSRVGLSRTYCIDHSNLKLNEAVIQKSSWVYLDGDFVNELDIPFNSNELTITPAGVFLNPSKPAASKSAVAKKQKSIKSFFGSN
jgi:hypothetical protein